jgi:predicted TIM-barrel enzyme
MIPSVFDSRPLVIAALHLPDPVADRRREMTWLEGYVLENARVFAKAGIPAVKLQDQTREPGPAPLETVATMAALARLIRHECPTLTLGIIVQAHDARAPIAIAHAAGASFIRLKVFVGWAMTAEGPRTALANEARQMRATVGAEHVAILADVFDRTSVPMVNLAPERAALWAEQMGANGLVLTGADFADSLARVHAARAAGVRRPILIGGGIDAGNVRAALGVADGVVVSTALMRRGAGRDETKRWDPALCRQFMDAARV